jgi:hypothetical protein
VEAAYVAARAREFANRPELEALPALAPRNDALSQPKLDYRAFR